MLFCGLTYAQYVEPIDSLPLTPPTPNEVVELYLPDFITPNSDGINDELIIGNLETYPYNSITIYSRWGNVVYKEENYQNDWNGRNVCDGVYFYTIYVRNSIVEGVCQGDLTITR